MIPIHSFITQTVPGVSIGYQLSLGDNLAAPSFVTLIGPSPSSLGSIKVDILTRKSLYQLYYNLIITGSIVYLSGASGQSLSTNLIIPLQVIISQTSAPYFQGGLKDLSAICGEAVPFTLPKMIDPDYEDVPSIYSIEWGGAKNFTSGKYPSYATYPKNCSD